MKSIVLKILNEKSAFKNEYTGVLVNIIELLRSPTFSVKGALFKVGSQQDKYNMLKYTEERYGQVTKGQPKL